MGTILSKMKPDEQQLQKTQVGPTPEGEGHSREFSYGIFYSGNSTPKVDVVLDTLVTEESIGEDKESAVPIIENGCEDDEPLDSKLDVHSTGQEYSMDLVIMKEKPIKEQKYRPDNDTSISTAKMEVSEDISDIEESIHEDKDSFVPIIENGWEDHETLEKPAKKEIHLLDNDTDISTPRMDVVMGTLDLIDAKASNYAAKEVSSMPITPSFEYVGATSPEKENGMDSEFFGLAHSTGQEQQTLSITSDDSIKQQLDIIPEKPPEHASLAEEEQEAMGLEVTLGVKCVMDFILVKLSEDSIIAEKEKVEELKVGLEIPIHAQTEIVPEKSSERKELKVALEIPIDVQNDMNVMHEKSSEESITVEEEKDLMVGLEIPIDVKNAMPEKPSESVFLTKEEQEAVGLEGPLEIVLGCKLEKFSEDYFIADDDKENLKVGLEEVQMDAMLEKKVVVASPIPKAPVKLEQIWKLQVDGKDQLECLTNFGVESVLDSDADDKISQEVKDTMDCMLDKIEENEQDPDVEMRSTSTSSSFDTSSLSIQELESELAKKREILSKLNLVKIHKYKFGKEELELHIQSWKEVGQNVLLELYKRMKIAHPNISMENLLSNYGIDPEFIGYDIEEESFV